MRTAFRAYIDAGKGLCTESVKRLAETNYYSARAFYKYQLKRAKRRYKEPPLLVYQMGKVGSSTVVRSLNVLKLDMPIYHPHFLSKNRIAETEAKRKKFFRTERYSYLKRPWLYQFLRGEIDKALIGEKWRIVTLTREPIGRNISTFFENLAVRTLHYGHEYEIQSDYYDISPTIVKLDALEELTDLFLSRVRHNSPLVFFDRELKAIFGIDVFAHEFPKAKGYDIYEGENADVLLIRLEDLSRCARKAFHEFLHIEDFALVDTNIGSEKDYAPIYKKFKQTVSLPETYMNDMYQSKYMQHFYSQEEIKRFERIWCK